MLREIISHREAKRKELARYFNGKPCPKGHVCERFTSNRDCVQCVKARGSLVYFAKDDDYRERKKRKSNEHYWNNLEMHRDRANARYKKHPEQFRARSANRRTKNGCITGEDITAVLLLQNYECKYCRSSLADYYEVDHAMPLSKGGLNIIENIQCLCHRCHANKTAVEVREAKRKKETGLKCV